MNCDWTAEKSDRLAGHYQSFLSDVKAPALRRIVLSGMENYIAFPAVCQEAVEATATVTSELREVFSNPDLRDRIESIRTGDIGDDPGEISRAFDRMQSLETRIAEMTRHRDAFIEQYSQLYQGALEEVCRAANRLLDRIEKKPFLGDFSENILLDAAGYFVPGLGTVAFLKRRVLQKSEFLKKQLEASASTADSFVVFSEYMHEVTGQMKLASESVRLDAKVLVEFVEIELPERIDEMRLNRE